MTGYGIGEYTLSQGLSRPMRKAYKMKYAHPTDAVREIS